MAAEVYDDTALCAPCRAHLKAKVTAHLRRQIAEIKARTAKVEAELTSSVQADLDAWLRRQPELTADD